MNHPAYGIEVLVCLKTAKLGDPNSVQILMVSRGGPELRLPGAFLPANISPLQTASLILKQSLGVEAIVAGTGWIPLQLVNVLGEPERSYKGERIVSVLYTGIVPETLPTTREEFVWTPTRDLVKGNPVYHDHIKLIQESLVRI